MIDGGLPSSVTYQMSGKGCSNIPAGTVVSTECWFGGGSRAATH
jgi:hypothetical protein